MAKHTIRCRLQEWIDAMGLTYSAVAESADVDVGAVRRLAKNQFDRVDCATWQSICKLFNKQINELFYEEKPED